VVEYNNNRLQKFSAGKWLQTVGSAGSGNGQFNAPRDVAVDSGGNIWVTDSNNNRVQIFNSSGVWQKKVGTAGSDNGQFNAPIGISVSAPTYGAVAVSQPAPPVQWWIDWFFR
jgi:DNA-binding beta-propeller fold protein YncE